MLEHVPVAVQDCFEHYLVLTTIYAIFNIVSVVGQHHSRISCGVPLFRQLYDLHQALRQIFGRLLLSLIIRGS
jgi:hypothetical protein